MTPSHDYQCRNATSLAQLCFTLLGYAALWVLVLSTAMNSAGWTVFYCTGLSFLVVRLFNIQHDCSHHSYFSKPLANDLIGTALGIITLTPFFYWKKHHLLHHGTSGNLDRRGHGDILLYTVKEFKQAAPHKRLFYRLYRNPFFFLAVGSMFYFILKMRIHLIAPARSKERWSIIWLDAAICVIYLTVFFSHGRLMYVAAMHLSSVYIGGLIGLWLFFVQHQFEDVYWRRAGAWNFNEAAERGSSHLQLPKFLEWLFIHINLHDVHHLYPKIPNYLLEKKMRDMHLQADRANTVPLREALRSFRLKLWDEEAQAFVGFPGRRKGLT